MDIRYGELDFYIPLKFNSALSLDKRIKRILKYFDIDKNTKSNNKKKVDANLLAEALIEYEKRCAFINEEYKDAADLYGKTYINLQERLLLFPIKITLYNGKKVWLNTIVYLFDNDMCVLKLELPLVDVDSELLQCSEWDNFIQYGKYGLDMGKTDLTTIDNIVNMYKQIIQDITHDKLTDYYEMLHHIILIDFDDCPYNVNDISDDLQEKLFGIISGKDTEAPYTSYKNEAKEYINKHTWGSHNIRCILKLTGGCLSIVDRTVQEYWINKYTVEQKSSLDYETLLDMNRQYVNKVQNNTEFPLIILLLKKINALEAISNKYQKKFNSKRVRKQKIIYLQNNVFITRLQEECCGTVTEQVKNYESMMPYYFNTELIENKNNSINEILKEKGAEKNEQLEKTISIGSIFLSLLFGLPAIQETLILLRNMCVWIEKDILYLSINGISVILWVILNVFISIKIFIAK